MKNLKLIFLCRIENLKNRRKHSHVILCITWFLGHSIERQLHESLQTNLKECNFVKYLYSSHLLQKNWNSGWCYHCIYSKYTPLLASMNTKTNGNFLFFVFLLKSRHCIKYTRIRVFTDPYFLVYESVKTRILPYFMQREIRQALFLG